MKVLTADSSRTHPDLWKADKGMSKAGQSSWKWDLKKDSENKVTVQIINDTGATDRRVHAAGVCFHESPKLITISIGTGLADSVNDFPGHLNC